MQPDSPFSGYLPTNVTLDDITALAESTPTPTMPDALRQVEAALQDAQQALESLAGCLPNRMCVYGAYGELWSEHPPNRRV